MTKNNEETKAQTPEEAFQYSNIVSAGASVFLLIGMLECLKSDFVVMATNLRIIEGIKEKAIKEERIEETINALECMRVDAEEAIETIDNCKDSLERCLQRTK